MESRRVSVQGVILYGPPAAGKDTITQHLTTLDPRYVLFPRLKVGPGRTASYRMATAAQLAALRGRGDVIWENERYGAVYVVDRTELRRRLASHVPVVHLGQLDAVEAVTRATPGADWLIVYLSCPREIARHRIAARATGDLAARLAAWDQTAPLPDADATFDTSRMAPADVARAIHARVQGAAAGRD